MTIREPIIPAGQEFSYNRLHFAPAFRVGSTVYVSGVIGRGADGVPDDPAAEFALAFEIMATTLEAAGAAMSDIVELTSFHVGMDTIGEFAAAKDAAIAEPYPAWTVIGCSSLIDPKARAEVKATAVITSEK
ncbi:MAG: RidA family protein [Actinobacteria bacterium]|nr:RidA family protein [Actinomycetota bacterium]